MQEVIINEEWFSISDYINYQVSNIGRVRNTTGSIFSPSADTGGYLHVRLKLNSKGALLRVHRLVAYTFIKKPENFNDNWVVNHIDMNKLNNNCKNLEWCTQSENHKHAWSTGLKVNTENKRLATINFNKQTKSKT